MKSLRHRLGELRRKLSLRQRMTTTAGKYRSLVTRGAIIREYLRTHPVCKLQVGSGMSRLAGWLNTDLVAGGDVIFLDATKRFPFPDGSIDYIFTEHMFEHITYQQGEHFLSESHRVLKPGGWIRLATPNLAFLISLYSQPEIDLHRRYIQYEVDQFATPKIHSRTVVVNNFFYNWGHRFIYDEEMLKHILTKAGFLEVTQFASLESSDPHLRNLEYHGKVIGPEFNALESIVVEAHKS